MYVCNTKGDEREQKCKCKLTFVIKDKILNDDRPFNVFKLEKILFYPIRNYFIGQKKLVTCP
jgi:hypothetical protein